MQTTLSPAVILDRDGTLHRDTGYLIRFEDFESLPGVVEGLKILQEKGFRLFVATNQSGVARGMFPLEDVAVLNEKIRGFFLERGVRIEDIAVCPHHPEGKVKRYSIDCECRKPKPGMLLELAKRHHLNLGQSYMVGDHLRDARAGIAAGATGVLISENHKRMGDGETPLQEFSSLLEFASNVKGAHGNNDR